MSKLVFKSVLDPKQFSLSVVPRCVGISFEVFDVGDEVLKGVTISYDDARKLRDFLNNRLCEQAPKSTDSGPWVYLETDSKGNNTWEQFPTPERAKSFADKRVAFDLKYQAVAVLRRRLEPVVTTSYEWREIG
jgi:hypothetical protein